MITVSVRIEKKTVTWITYEVQVPEELAAAGEEAVYGWAENKAQLHPEQCEFVNEASAGRPETTVVKSEIINENSL